MLVYYVNCPFVNCPCLSVSWQAPDENVRNGKLTGYQVCYSNKTKSTCIERNTTLTNTIHNLQPVAKYFVTVSAGTSAVEQKVQKLIKQQIEVNVCILLMSVAVRKL